MNCLWYDFSITMGTKQKTALWVGVAVVIIAVCVYLLRDASIPVLQPRGEIGQRQYELLLFAAILSLVVVIPVFALTIFIVMKYRAGAPKKAQYAPEWDHDKRLEFVWWGIPILLIIVLSIVTWRTSHTLDPYKPLASDKKPLTIQVVALQWKWLFIYPEQGIASVNLTQFPVDRPIRFQITSDAPMNSFWIPQLGGQIYAMSGMSTLLNLQANTAGDYRGVSANISGKGFSGMVFTARASTEADFGAWVRDVHQAPHRLSIATYHDLAMPSQDNPVSYYGSIDANLYDTIVMSYMGGGHGMHQEETGY